VGSIPPLHELAKNAGVNLPQFLGQMDPDALKADDTPEA
jgi:hypothetical protein